MEEQQIHAQLPQQHDRNGFGVRASVSSTVNNSAECGPYEDELQLPGRRGILLQDAPT